MSYYMDVKEELFLDPQRKIPIDNNIHSCEGQGFTRHKCWGGFEMNHILIPANIWQNVSAADKNYFHHVINCALNCTGFHRNHGHTRGYRDWHLERVQKLFTAKAVQAWIDGAPLIGDYVPGQITSEDYTVQGRMI